MERCPECGCLINGFEPCPNEHCQNGRVVVNASFVSYEYDWCPTCKGEGTIGPCPNPGRKYGPTPCTEYKLEGWPPKHPATEEIKWIDISY